MKYFIVVAHPEPQSFNLALSSEATMVLQRAGHEVRVLDLNREGWDPVSDRRNFLKVKNAERFNQQDEELHATENRSFNRDIQNSMDALFWCDILVLQFPLWWFGLPAIMKGWVDKTFAYSAIYGPGKRFENGSFIGKRAMLSLTTGDPERRYGEGSRNPPLESLLLPIHHGIFKYNGFTVVEPFVAWEPGRLTLEDRKQYLNDLSAKLLNIPQ
jgi:NAD(P)H dehydrogenase (quinone)